MPFENCLCWDKNDPGNWAEIDEEVPVYAARAFAWEHMTHLGDNGDIARVCVKTPATERYPQGRTFEYHFEFVVRTELDLFDKKEITDGSVAVH